MTEILLLGKRYTIYASKREAMDWGERCVDDPWHAEVGDYVNTSTGHWIPITGRDPWYGEGQENPNNIDVLKYPGGMFYRFRNRIRIDKNVYWDANYFLGCEIRLEAWKCYAAQLISRGMQPNEAVQKVLDIGMRSRGNLIAGKAENIARKLFFEKLWVNYLFTETAGFMGLKEALEARGLNEEYLAGKIFDLAEGDRVPANLRLWALNTIKEQVSEPIVQGKGVYAKVRQIEEVEGRVLSGLDQLRLQEGSSTSTEQVIDKETQEEISIPNK